MVGLLVASPIFASLAKSLNPFRLIDVGLSVWTLAIIGCGGSLNFWMIAVCRMFVGVGEASFINLAAPFIDDNAPVSQKVAWLGIFYMCAPTGIALGYVYGGLVGSHFSWRYAFFGEAILMLPFAVLGFIIKPLSLKGFTLVESNKALTSGEKLGPNVEDKRVADGKVGVLDGNEKLNERLSKETALSKVEVKPLNQFTRFWKDMKVLLCDKVFITNVLGCIPYNFVLGSYSYWGPKIGYPIYHMKNADMMFGGITIVCGILGTVAGGLVLDWMNPTISNAFKLLSGATLLGAIFCSGALCSRNLYGFIALFTVGELFIFATQGPINFVCLHCVEPGLRALSMALSTVSIHIFGDIPSPPIVGVVQDHLNNWRFTILILTSILFPAAALWFIGIFLNGEDKFNKDGERQAIEDSSSNPNPLPEGETKTTKRPELVEQ